MIFVLIGGFNEQVEEGCELNSADEIAAAVNQLLRTIQDDAAFTWNTLKMSLLF